MSIESVIDSEIAAQFSYRFDNLEEKTKIGIATLVQNLQVRGYGKKFLIDALKEARVEEGLFYRGTEDDDRIGKLFWIACDNGRIVGDGLTVDQVHFVIVNSGVVV
jgi:hypothetical protein